VNSGGKTDGAAGVLSLNPELFRTIRGFIFDFDGTLYDLKGFARRLILAYPPDIGKIRAERVVRRRFSGADYGSPEGYYDAYFSALAEACGKSGDRMREWYFTHYMPRMVRVLERHYRLRPGAEALLSGLGSSAVYSDYPLLRERFAALGFVPGGTVRLYGPESFGAQKPAPRPFLSIAGDLGLSPEEILVIGDREDTDGAGARSAGMAFFHLNSGEAWEKFRAALSELLRP
jgi:FMN phosphatase YigB (HAD superfamily)